MENNLEVRYITELRADPEKGIITGRAIVFDSESQDLGGFKEVVKPEAVTREFLDKQDIVMLYNHNADYGVLARSKNGKGSLKYDIDEQGVTFEFKAKRKDQGIVESIAAGDLDACSFAFRIGEEGDKWEKRSDGSYLRTISGFDCVRDFSLVVNPAYTATSVDVRKLDELRKKEEEDKSNTVQKNKEEEESKKEEQRKQTFDKYSADLRKKYLV